VAFKARDEEPRANMCTHAFRCVLSAHLRNRCRGPLLGAAAGRLFVVESVYVSFRGPAKAGLRQIEIRTLGQTSSFSTMTEFIDAIVMTHKVENIEDVTSVAD